MVAATRPGQPGSSFWKARVSAIGVRPLFVAVVMNGGAWFLKEKGRQRDDNVWMKRMEVAYFPGHGETFATMVPSLFVSDFNAVNLQHLRVDPANPDFDALEDALRKSIRPFPQVHAVLGNHYTCRPTNSNQGIHGGTTPTPTLGQGMESHGRPSDELRPSQAKKLLEQQQSRLELISKIQGMVAVCVEIERKSRYTTLSSIYNDLA